MQFQTKRSNNFFLFFEGRGNLGKTFEFGSLTLVQNYASVDTWELTQEKSTYVD